MTISFTDTDWERVSDAPYVLDFESTLHVETELWRARHEDVPMAYAARGLVTALRGLAECSRLEWELFGAGAYALHRTGDQVTIVPVGGGHPPAESDYRSAAESAERLWDRTRDEIVGHRPNLEDASWLT